MRSRMHAAVAGAALIAAGLPALGSAGPAARAAAVTAPAFSTVPSPDVKNSDYNELDGVAAVTAGDAWAVGFARVGTRPLYHALVEHWNGTAWSIARSAALPANHYTFLHAVSALSASDIWAVGDDGTSGHSLIEHWDGTAWSVVPSPAAEPADSVLSSVAAISATDVWAVGHSAVEVGKGSGALIEHWDGSAWSVVPSPPLSDEGRAYLKGVAAVSAGDVWAVGFDQHPSAPVIEHWNGTAWKRVGQPADGYDAGLSSVAVISRDDAWAVGVQNLDQTVTEHWDGTTWTLVPSPTFTIDNAQDTLAGVTALGADDVWTVGSWAKEDHPSRTLAEHWNGSAWQIVPATDPAHGGNLLAGVSGTATGQPLWAAGSAISGGTPQSSTLVETTTG